MSNRSQLRASSLWMTGNALWRTGHGLLRKYRTYFRPSHWRTFREVIEGGKIQAEDAQRKFVYLDLTNPEIDLDGSRYIITLVWEFEALGFIPAYRRRFPFHSNYRYKRYKTMLLDHPYRVVDSISDLPEGTAQAVITDVRGLPTRGLKTLRISYRLRRPSAPSEILMNFRPYPKAYPFRIDSPDISNIRPWRVFFSGTVTKDWARPLKQFGKMTRAEILESLRTSLREEEKHEPSAPGEIVHGPRFVRPNYRIPLEQWFTTLHQSDFFVACPGGAMPICHNVAEALSVGAIPILEYPEYLDPPLQHGVTCLAFSGKDSLIKTVRESFALSDSQLRAMRAACLEYYRQHMAPGKFASDFMASDHREMTLLFNAHLSPVKLRH